MKSVKNSKGKYVLHQSKQKKGKNIYTYYSLAWYFRENGKPYRKILRNIGVLSPDEIAYQKKCIDCLNHVPNTVPCNLENISVITSKEYLSCAVGLHFWNYWELSSVFDKSTERKNVATSEIAKILTVMRFSKACSKSSTVKLYPQTTLPELTGISPKLFNNSRVFRELKHIEAHREDIGKHIFNHAKNKKYTKGKLLFYDLSSGNLTGLRCVMAKWGHSKDGYTNHVVLMLVITPEGYPIYWEMLEGNTVDVKTIEKLISKTENIYGHIDSVICFDRGMVSDDNLELLQGKHINFITALDGNQLKYFDDLVDYEMIKRVKQLDYCKDVKEIKQIFKSNDFNCVDNNLFTQELPLTSDIRKEIKKETSKLNPDKRRYFVAFNPELAYLKQKHRIERVALFSNWIEEYNHELSKALGDRKEETVTKAIKSKKRKLQISDIDINYELENYQVENKNIKGQIKKSQTYRILVDQVKGEAYTKAKKYDGIWILITNLTKEQDDNFFETANFKNYFEVYRLKNNIEEAFRILSDFVGIEPFYVYKTQRIKAHFTLCVLSYLLDITILNKIRNSDTIENMDLHTIFNSLQKCKQDVIKVDEQTIVSRTTQMTKKQKQILDVLKCNYLVSHKHLSLNDIVGIKKTCTEKYFSSLN